MEELDDKRVKGQRVKEVRKALGLTQQNFAEKINLETSNAISMIENGINSLTEQNINLICTPNRLKPGYTVNEEWLRNGGDDWGMFKSPALDNDRIKLYDDEGQELPAEEEELIDIYRQLTPPNKIVAEKQISALLEGQPGVEKEGRRANTAKDFG